MGRKSAIEKLPEQIKSRIEKHMRENRLTLDEIILDLQQQFPDAANPSRSSLGRYRQSYDEMASRLRSTQDMARMMVTEFGEDVDDRAGALLAQAVTTLTTHAALMANDPASEAITVKEVGELARAARAVLQARQMSVKEREFIAQAARDKMLREQEQRLVEVRGVDGMSEELEGRIRDILLGKKS